MADELLAYRDRFPTLRRGPYFAAHTLGPMPDSVPAALAGFAEEWAAEGVVAWQGWLERIRAAAGVLEELFNAPAGSVVLGPNVSVLAGQVLSCFDWSGPRSRLVTTDLEFPTCDYLYRAQETVGAKLEVVPSRDLAVDLERLLEAIDEQTALVAVTHVAFRSSALLDAAAVAARAHQVGALLLLDTYQSAGTVPVDVRALDVDLVVGGSVKWLLGGPGTGYLYAKPEVAEGLSPRLVGWFGHEAPFQFRPSPIAYAPGAGRFVTGTPNVAAHVMAAEGFRIVAAAGVERIRAKSQRQVARMLQGFLEQGAVVRGPAEVGRRGGSVVVDFDGAEQATGELIRRGYTCDHRPGAGLRLGPHLYTSDDECDAVVAEVAAIRAGR
ncbi:MAG TPA: aminotransferase class V-fold PLP-dependent enzyme [Actinomycetota bacterium]|nr:aminotransferase class V-fold PLP-dependent enzyme [Actinomycetota bacterium]